MASDEFDWTLRVYIEDTDAGGIVYHANYLCYLERARTEWLRSKGFEQKTLSQQQGVQFVVHKLSLEYKMPAYLDDALDLKLKLIGLRKTGMQLQQTLMRAGQILLTAQVELACVASNGRPKAIPTQLFACMQDAMAEYEHK